MSMAGKRTGQVDVQLLSTPKLHIKLVLPVSSGIYLGQSESKKKTGSQNYDNEFSQQLIIKKSLMAHILNSFHVQVCLDGHYTYIDINLQ